MAATAPQQSTTTTVEPQTPQIFDLVKQDIASQISKLSGFPADALVGLIEPVKKREHGDFALPVSKLLKFGKLPEPAPKLATTWSAQIQVTNLIEKATATGPFINFTIRVQPVAEMVLRTIFDKKEHFGFSNKGAGKSVVVEYSSPNIAKPFHAGHLRSTIIGNFVKNIHQALGYNVVSMNWLGDWGKQYGMLALGFKKYGSEEKLQTAPLRHLYEIYVAINKDKENNVPFEGETVDVAAKAYFKRMEDGDPEAIGLWKRFRDLSIVELKNTYARLNVTFDVWTGESQMKGADLDQLEADMQKQGLLVEKEGARVVDLNNCKMGDAVMRKRDGTTVYMTRDLVGAIQRWERFSFEKMYYVVSSSQALHFQQMFKILDLMHLDWVKKCEHIQFGMVQKISTRKGTAVFLDDILDEAAKVMLETMQANTEKLAELEEDPKKVADIVGVSAVLIQDYSARRIKDYEFNWKRMTSFEGNTGPYLQYAHARLCSIERKTGIPVTINVNFSLLSEPEAASLVFLLAKYPEIIDSCYEQLEACPLVQYLFELAHAVSVAHSVLWVKGREQPLAEARMLLFWAARVILGNGLRLLGLTPLERM